MRLPELLPPAQYATVGQVLSALDATWNPRQRAFEFPAHADPAALIAGVLDASVMPVHERRGEGYVRTPDDLADDLCEYPHTDLRWLPAGSRVLEPSAGDGSLVAAILRANPHVRVTAVEPNPARARWCAALGPAVDVHTATFETYAARALTTGTRFDAVIANPPFATSTDPKLWAEHLRIAWHLLHPGARMVCVVPASAATRADTVYADARAFITHHGTLEPLPPGAFAASGTMFGARVARLTKPIGTQHPDFHLSIPDTAPVRVQEPQFTGPAAREMPVQVWWDGWRRRDRVLRYRGRCVVCGWLLWGFDDGENDPRGILGDFSAGFSLNPADFDLTGPQIGLCCRCGNDADLYRAGLLPAQAQWHLPAENRPRVHA
ncbi:class I SAM-dependent methyltransferase [Catenuloplanes indicus]|uniref:RNA methylase n=1 Tax=Catenuloplanes indicus TaxID=137267 RepID=A0AAE3W019_9ACTN|nr:class I SAM-dependent methyltransferase [Catenuloplanes indicus]MDQ0366851.1 putative RNA methylase [Catenuloplanes indicus]